MNIIPTVIEKSSNKEYAYDLYSRLLKDRIVFLTGEINDSVASIVISELLYLDNLSNEDIYLYINSPGGSITSGMSIYDTMNFIKSKVITIGIGMTASMAAFLLSSGNIRYALPNTEVMIHQPLGGAQGQATDIKIAAERIIKLKEKLNQILAKNTNQPLEKIYNDTERDNFLSASEALEYGLIDKIIEKNEF
ncbi:MAG TPA: ATP-dependent Clp protease proteolytic subunit [Candidatus Onthocola stercorigallinarum]|nr:ATP-dependent Clp protease proteolytic subunit [Candidatus Onthocola stercorigallinarum]